MNPLRCVFLLQFATALALGQAVDNGKPASLSNEPEALVRSLYAQVVVRHPIGIPRETDVRIYAPYLSSALQHRIELARACARDWDRTHPDPRDRTRPDPNLKPEMDWLELGIFSGRSEEAAPQAFEIEKTESEKDGSFRVYVRMTWEWPPAPKLVWTVAAIVVREGVHLVVDDIDYLTDKSGDENALSRLSEALSAGCDGPRWVGWPRPDQR